MENKTEEKTKHIIELVTKRQDKHIRILRDSKYGKFIIQTNEIQLYLVPIISQRVFQCSKNFDEYLERLTLENLINCFRICVKNSDELSLVNSLNSYRKKRNALAHKMYTEKPLTETGCESAIKLGEKLLIELKSLIK